MNLTLGLAQITPRLGSIPANLQTHLDHIERAAEQGVQLLLFPELSLTGYNLQDLVYELAMHPTPANPTFKALLDAGQQHDMDLAVGFVEEDDRNRFFILFGLRIHGNKNPTGGELIRLFL